jgi:hypothetical protein
MSSGRILRFVVLVVSLAIAGCAAPPSAVPTAPSLSNFENVAGPAALQSHAIIGFSVDTPVRAATAAREGVTTTILYGGSPPPGSALTRALQARNQRHRRRRFRADVLLGVPSNAHRQTAAQKLRLQLVLPNR